IGEVTGDDWGYGVTLGILAELSDSTRLGLGYRSQIKHTLEGDFTVAGGFVDTVSADLTTPDQVTAGFYHDISEQFAIMGEVGWTGWNSFDEIRIVGDTIGTVSVTPEDWDNSWFYGLGATWRANEKLTLRSGIAFDQSPVPDNRRTPRIPDEDRTWVSLGLNYSLSPAISIDAGYTHIFVSDPVVNLAAGYTTPAAPALTATYEASVDIVALSATFRF
ncbi:MAG: TonB-dependent receptor, partial [Proteobacteria bacterium]|nr:TonB-dependent receptor [Pseudomonadota bacterium]